MFPIAFSGSMLLATKDSWLTLPSCRPHAVRLQHALTAFEVFGQTPRKILPRLVPQQTLQHFPIRLLFCNVPSLRSAPSDRTMTVSPRSNVCGCLSFSLPKLVKQQVSGGRWEWAKTPAVSKFDKDFEARAFGPPGLRFLLSPNYPNSQAPVSLRLWS